MRFNCIFVILVMCGCESESRVTDSVPVDQQNEMRRASGHKLASMQAIIALDVFAEEEAINEITTAITKAKSAIVNNLKPEPFAVAATRSPLSSSLVVYYFDYHNEINDIVLLGHDRSVLLKDSGLNVTHQGLEFPWRTYIVGCNLESTDHLRKTLASTHYVQLVSSGNVIGECGVIECKHGQEN